MATLPGVWCYSHWPGVSILWLQWLPAWCLVVWLQWLPCLASGVRGSLLELCSPVSVYCDSSGCPAWCLVLQGHFEKWLTPVATLPGIWCHRVTVRTVWLCVSILWLQWLPCLASGVTGSLWELCGSVSVYCDSSGYFVRWCRVTVRTDWLGISIL